MAEYDSAARLALRLIAKKGEAVTLRNPVTGEANEARPWRPEDSGGAPVDTDARVAFLPLSPTERDTLRYADGTLARTGDLVGYMAGEDLNRDFAPDLDHHLIRGDGSVWVIRSPGPLAPNGRVLLYTMLVSR